MARGKAHIPTFDIVANMKRRDLWLGVLGILVSLSVFAAEPYRDWRRYIVALSPIGVVLVAIGGLHLRRWFRDMKNRLALATVTRVDATAIVRILNDAGDVAIERRTRIQLISDASKIYSTPESGAFLENEATDLPPPANVTDSLQPGRRLVSRFLFSSLVHQEGADLHKYSWSYEIEPPLVGRGDFVEFTNTHSVLRDRAKAFTPDGDVSFWVRPSYDFEATASLIAPPGYRIEVLGAWIEDFDGTRINVERDEMPKLSVDRTVLEWRLIWRTGARHGCRYRLNRFTSA